MSKKTEIYLLKVCIVINTVLTAILAIICITTPHEFGLKLIQIFSIFITGLSVYRLNIEVVRIGYLEQHEKFNFCAYLVRFVNNPEKTENILGDLDENYTYDLEKFGPRFAKFNYAKECLGVFGEGVKAWVLRQLPFAQAISALLGRFSGR